MRATTWLLACVVLLACSSDATPNDGGLDATQAADSQSDAASEAGPGDAGTKPDGCIPIEGGLACDPAHIACGALLCDAGAQICCINDGGAKETCTLPPPSDGGKPPPNSCTGTKMACDEAADCPSGQQCCGFVGVGGGFAATCQTGCGTALQLCHGSAECITGECVVQQCHGVTVETCGNLCP